MSLRAFVRGLLVAVGACALTAVHVPAQQATVRVEREPGPGVRLRLSWDDLGPSFTYTAWRSASPVGVVGGGTTVGTTDAEWIVDTPPAGLVFYDVVALGGPSCPDDAFEENDTIAASAPAASGWMDLYRCADDADFFSVTLAAGESLRAGLSHDPAVVPLALEVRGVGGALLASDPSFLTFTAAASGTYHVVVTGDAASEGPYRLLIEAPFVPASCDVDYAAPNQTRATAIPGWPEWLHWSDLSVCESGEDWWTEDIVNDGTTIYVWVDPYGNINYDRSDLTWFIAEIYDVDGTTLLARGDSRDGSIALDPVVAAGTYYLRVRGYVTTPGEWEHVYAVGVSPF